MRRGLGFLGLLVTIVIIAVVGVIAYQAGWWLILAAITAALRARVTPTVARTIGIVSGLAIAGLGAVAVVASFGQ